MAAYSEEQCLKWLKEKCYVNVRKEWLDACIEFLKQEHRGGFSSQTQLNNLVFEQLLMADFQEISLGTLPTLGTGKNVSTLQGKHTLQINSLMDVGQSAYSQIQKIKGQDDLENQKENTSNNWEPKIKPSRMLFLHMTDGSKSIQAMEYQSIPCLNQSTAPGTKLQIQGPVSCRLGVLLLASKNVHILGGSVEELMEANPMWKVLHNAIGQAAPELPTCSSNIKETADDRDNTHPFLHTDVNGNNMHSQSQLGSRNNAYQQPYVSNSGSVLRSGDKRRSSNSGQREKINHSSRGKTGVQHYSNKRPFSSCSNRGMRNKNNNDVEGMFDGEDLFDDNGDENFDLDQLDRIEKEVIENNAFDDNIDENFDLDQIDQIEQEVIDNNVFDDNIDENFDLDQIDQIEQEVIQNNDHKANRKPDQRVNSSHTQNELLEEDFMDDDFDLDDFDMDQSRVSFSKIDSGHKKSREAVKTENIEKQRKTEKNCLPMAKKLKTATSRPETKKITENCVFTERRNDATERGGRSLIKNGTNQPTFNFDTQKSLSSRIKKKERNSEVVDLVGPKSISSLSIKVKTESRDEMSIDNHSFAFDDTANRESTSSMECEIRSEMGSKMGKKPFEKFGMKKSTQIPQQTTIQFNKLQPSPYTFVKKECIEVVDLVDEEDKDVPVAVTSEEPETLLPFTYLSQVLKDQPFFEERTFRIKGYISTLVSHTQVSDVSQRWKVIVKVNDGSASIDAALGEEVLTELLGTPLESFQYTMIEAKKNRDPIKCQALQQQTVQFQKKLSQISCLMDVHFSPSESNPLIIRLTEASRDDILGLISRLAGCR